MRRPFQVSIWSSAQAPAAAIVAWEMRESRVTARILNVPIHLGESTHRQSGPWVNSNSVRHAQLGQDA